MKNDLVKKMFRKFLIKIIIWTLSVLFFTIFLDLVIKANNYQWAYDFFPNLYEIVRRTYYNPITKNYIYFFCFIVWLIGVFTFLHAFFKKTVYYTKEILRATEDLVNKEIDTIELPKELEGIEKQMNQLKKESIQNEKKAREEVQRKNDLIVYLAHDLKTPLTSTIGYLSLLEEIQDMPKKQREKYIHIALLKSYRLEDLLNELFEIARFNSETMILEKENINLKLMLEQIGDEFYPLAKEMQKKVILDIKEAIFFKADANKLARVFSNLLKNAFSYSEDEEIKIEVKKKNGKVIITFTNKGNIPETKLAKIFEKFYRLDTSRNTKSGGSGLGLAISKEIIEAHAGKIMAKNEGEYTKFIIELPLKN